MKTDKRMEQVTKKHNLSQEQMLLFLRFICEAELVGDADEVGDHGFLAQDAREGFEESKKKLLMPENQCVMDALTEYLKKEESGEQPLSNPA